MRRVLSATLSTKQRMMKSQFTYSQKSSFSTLTRLGQQPKVVDTTTTNTNTTTQTAETNDPTASNPDFDRNDPEGRPFGKWLMNTYITFAAIAIVTFSVGFVWNQFDRSVHFLPYIVDLTTNTCVTRRRNP